MKINLPISVSILFIASIGGPAASAEDWPHWLGPTGNNIAPAGRGFETDLSKWKVAWKANVGRGYSSVAVANGRAFSVGHDGKSQEALSCFDATTGAPVWQYPYNAQLLPMMHPGGPNATPTILGNRVFIVSKDGQALCLSADKGEKVWQVNLPEVMGIKIPQWGFASSAVIDGNQILFSAGKVCALDVASGKTLWTSRSENLPGYTTPVVFMSGKGKVIAALDAKGISILSAKDGSEIVRHPFSAMFDMVATTPLVTGDGRRIFISSNTGAEMLDFDGEKISVVWSSKDIKNTMNDSVILNGALYGIDGRQEDAKSRMVSVNLADGKLNWARSDFGYGNTIGVGAMLLSLTEGGELVTIKPDAKNYQELSRLQILGKLCWTTPVYANDRIYTRNDKGDVICLSSK